MKSLVVGARIVAPAAVAGLALFGSGLAWAEDSTATATYAAYDVATRSIKLRSTVAHQEIAPCAQVVPLHPQL